MCFKHEKIKKGFKHETIIKWVSNRKNNKMGFKQIQ